MEEKKGRIKGCHSGEGGILGEEKEGKHNKWAAVVETIKAQKEGRIIGEEKRGRT
jgi:hypothetical protein